MAPGVVVELVDAASVRPLRHDVLRPGRPVSEAVFDGDDLPGAAHVAAHVATRRTEVLAVGTVHPSPVPWEPERTDGWRIRGMATLADRRDRGLGRAVLDALLDHVAARGGGLVWCNARTAALSLYARAGFIARGEVFDVPGIGPHVQVWRVVDATDRPND